MKQDLDRFRCLLTDAATIEIVDAGHGPASFPTAPFASYRI
jgi:hypothetical protein